MSGWCTNPSYVNGAPCGCPAHEAREAERERQEQKRKERK